LVAAKLALLESETFESLDYYREAEKNIDFGQGEDLIW